MFYILIEVMVTERGETDKCKHTDIYVKLHKAIYSRVVHFTSINYILMILLKRNKKQKCESRLMVIYN